MIAFNKGVMWSVLTVLVPVSLQAFYALYVAHYVDKNLFGQFVLIQTTIAGASALLLTMPAAAVTRFYNHPGIKVRFINESRLINYFFSLISAIFVFIFIFFYLDQFSLYTAFMSAFLSFLIFNFSFRKSLIFMEIDRSSFFIITLLEKSCRFLLPVFGFVLIGSLEGMLASYFLGFLSVVMFFIFFRPLPKFNIEYSFKRLRLYAVYAWPLLPVALFSWVVSFSDRYFISLFLSDYDVGVYATISQFANFSLIFGSFFTVYINPLFYKKNSIQKSSANYYLSKSLYLLYLFLVLIFILYLLVPRSLISSVIGADALSNPHSFYVLTILLFSSLLTVAITSSSLRFTISKRLDLLMICWGVGSLFNLFGNLYIENFGILAAALSTCFSNFIVFIFILYFNYTKLG